MDETSDAIEQYLHIADMKGELVDLSDGEMVAETCQGMDQNLEESFWENVLAYERAKQVPFRVLLERDGFRLVPSDAVSDEDLPTKLAELIEAMASRRTFLEWTDHLSDRELYAHLVEISCEETVPDLPDDSETNCHLDVSNEDAYLRHYADEDSRAHWAESFPEMTIPPHEDLPYDRDRHLPKPPPPPDPYEDPEVAAQWCAENRKELAQRLADEGITHGRISPEPVAYAPPVAAVWAVEREARDGVTGWWALNGDCPFVIISARDFPHPRDFLREVSRRWRSELDAEEAARRQAEELSQDTKPLLRLEPFSMLRYHARTLERWADDDSAWDEEWRTPFGGSLGVTNP